MATSESSRPAPSVFLSYASEDRPAAQALRDALATFGLQVWYDESGLDGGDAWDQKIRRQIRECDFFMPVISAQTAARPEGYFRREWRLAVERTLDMADDYTFLLPVVIDDTTQVAARVPDKFLSVQWLRVPGGKTTSALEALCRRLVSRQHTVERPKRRADPPTATGSRARSREYPEFPREEPGQTMRFWVQVIGWAFQSAWVFFKGFPRWVQIVVYVWLAIFVLSRGCTPSDRHSVRIVPADPRVLKNIPADSGPSLDNPNAATLGSRIARQVTAEVGEELEDGRPLLAIPFSAPSDDPAGRELADSAFAQIYGRVELSHHGRVRLTKDPLSSLDLSAAVERGRALHAKYVLYGAVDKPAQNLTVKVVAVADGSLLWSQTYAVANADSSKIAAEVLSKVPDLGD
jgi:TolB-like protein